MAATVDIQRATRASKVRFTLPDGGEIVVEPPTLDQCIDCLLLDPVPGQPETPLDELRRFRRQFLVLFGEKHADLTKQLDKFQIGLANDTLWISGCGMNAELFARWQIAQRHLTRKQTALEMIDNLQRLSVVLGAELKMLPSAVGAQPLADLLAFQQELEKKRREVDKWEAALHDKELRG